MQWDCHIHIVGNLAEYPQCADRAYTADRASTDQLKQVAEKSGITDFVVVQPSFYQDDNSALVRALEVLGPRARGVGVINPWTISTAELHALADAGVVGVRLNVYSEARFLAGADAVDLVEATAKVVAAGNWHVEVIAGLPMLLDLVAGPVRSDRPIVIDHYGLPGELGPSTPEGKQFLTVLGSTNMWVKLSAPYRIGADPLRVAPHREWLAALVDTAPERCVWGSDWPHTPSLAGGVSAPDTVLPYRAISYDELLLAFRRALPSAQLADQILSRNPLRLYKS